MPSLALPWRCGALFIYYLRDRWLFGNTLGNKPRPFCLVARSGSLLPAVALLRIRLEPAVHLRHHRHVAVPELAGDQLERGSGPRHANRPMVSSIVQPVTS